jgi:hypothetical protein
MLMNTGLDERVIVPNAALSRVTQITRVVKYFIALTEQIVDIAGTSVSRTSVVSR